jgi:hypothetical protein
LRAAPGGYPPAYAKSTAEAELIKQYEFMHRIFHNARRRIDATDSDDERRRVLKILGDAALEEHSSGSCCTASVRSTRRKFCVSDGGACSPPLGIW